MRIRLWLETSPALLMTWVSLACLPGCDGGAAAQAEATAAYQSGLQHMREGQPEQAAADLLRAVVLNPEHAEAHFKLGKVLVYLSDVEGLLRDQGDPESVISTLHADGVERLVEDGVIKGGMLPKVRSCVEAIHAGVRKVHMIDGRMPHSLLLEIFTDKGVGTEIVNDEY